MFNTQPGLEIRAGTYPEMPNLNIFGAEPEFCQEEIAFLRDVLSRQSVRKLFQLHLHREWLAFVQRNPITSDAEELRLHLSYLGGMVAFAQNVMAITAADVAPV